MASVFAHSSHITLEHFVHSLSPVVIFPHISHGSCTISNVIFVLTLWFSSIPISLARVARLNSVASTHSIMVSSILTMLLLRVPMAEIFCFFSFIIMRFLEIVFML